MAAAADAANGWSDPASANLGRQSRAATLLRAGGSSNCSLRSLHICLNFHWLLPLRCACRACTPHAVSLCIDELTLRVQGFLGRLKNWAASQAGEHMLMPLLTTIPQRRWCFKRVSCSELLSRLMPCAALLCRFMQATGLRPPELITGKLATTVDLVTSDFSALSRPFPLPPRVQERLHICYQSAHLSLTEAKLCRLWALSSWSLPQAAYLQTLRPTSRQAFQQSTCPWALP